jgi:transcriptional regulator with XRE-family HTH domain
MRALRDQHGLTQQELAARAQVAIGTVRNIETATVVEPGYFTVLALLEALDIAQETGCLHVQSKLACIDEPVRRLNVTPDPEHGPSDRWR